MCIRDRTISLTQGSKGEVAYPEITVNDEGQWVVNGEVLMQNGIPVQAVGTPGKDGIAPKFRITDEGSFWQVKMCIRDSTRSRRVCAGSSG